MDRRFHVVDVFPEDPATGSSNGCLAAYLARHRYLGDSTVAARVEQGYEMGRPSLLQLRADDDDDGEAGSAADGDAVTVEVGGQVVPVAEGTLL
jgi:trans-2,3-dihydro-3-hydroxyanthranilate isomerase